MARAMDRADITAFTEQEVRDQVERVLRSPPFERSKRMSRFLQFLCDEMLSGRGARLKEYTLAVEVFDKPEDFDPATSATVRVEAGRLRRLLDQYRAEAGREDPIAIAIPKGSYCPVLEPNVVPAALDKTAEEQGTETVELRASEQMLGGDKRLVTVVSCALAGEAIASDGEEFLRACDETAALCNAIAQRHGGMTDAQASDRIIIYFGWPCALEDAAGRAITATLEMISELAGRGTPVGDLRIGIATGPVVAHSPSGTPLIVGQAPALATRILSQAPPGGILVADSTRRASHTAFEMIPAGSIETARGEQVPLWRALRKRTVRTRFWSNQSADRYPMVGRQEEIALLQNRWALAQSGEGQVVILEGEAGIGKSRLAEAALNGMKPRGFHIRVQCSPHHANSPLYPCIELLRALLRKDAARPSVLGMIEELLDRYDIGGPMSRDALARLLFDDESGASLALSASQRRDFTHQLLLRMLQGEIARHPTVLLIEDMHWADPATIELIERVVATLDGSRLLLILTGRPGASARFARLSDATLLRLSRLPRSECKAMIDAVVGETPLSADVRATIIERASGVPLFLEELTKAFLVCGANPAHAGAVPDTLHDLLATQLGHLGSARTVAQVAAVLGPSFPRELLHAVIPDDAPLVDAALDRLLAAHVLNSRRSEAGEQLVFRHALLRDAAYGSIVESNRRELHHRVGTTLVDLFPDLSANHPEVIAGHFHDAGQPIEAIPFWIDAGRLAAMRYELTEAATNYRSALAAQRLLPSDGPNRERQLDLLLQLGMAVRSARGYADPELQTIYEEARSVAEDLGRQTAVASAIYGLWTHAAGRGAWKTASGLAEAFEQHVRIIEDDGQLEIESARLLGASMAFRGRFAIARDHFDRAVQLYVPGRHGPRFGYDPGAVSEAYLALTLWHLGEIEASDHHARRALQLAEGTAHTSTLTMVLSWLIFHAVCRGDLAAVHAHNERLQALCTERDCHYWRPFGAACAEWAAFQTDGKPARLDRLIAHTGDFRELYLTSCLLVMGADMCCELGRPDQGLQLVAQAQVFTDEHDERIWEAERRRVEARLHLHRSPPDVRSAMSNVRQAIRIAREQRAIVFEQRAQDLASRHEGQLLDITPVLLPTDTACST